MAKNKAEKNKALVFENETDKSSERRVVTKKRKDFTKPDPKSGKLRPYGGTGEGNRMHDNVPPEQRCTAKRAKDGERCTKLKITGAEVCGTHGGRAPQVMRKAMARLQNATDKLVQELLAIAMDPEEPTPNRIRALDSALDRAGIKSKDKLDIHHEVPRYEQMLTEIMRVPSERTEEHYRQLQIDKNDDRY